MAIRSFFVGILITGALTGCDQKPDHQPQSSSVSAASASVATGSNAGPLAGRPAVSDSPSLRTILSLNQAGTTEIQNSLVRIRGTVLDERPGEFIVVNDGTGTVFAETHQAVLPKVKTLADLSGQPVSDYGSVSLKNAVASPVTAGSSSNDEAVISSDKPTTLPQLTKVWEIRDLPAEKAAWHYPVHLRAVVTVNAKVSHYFYVQDDTAGITVTLPDIATNLNPGDAVIIEGVSDPGGFSPIVLASNVTVTGTAPLPEARPETLFQLAGGQDGSQWIEVRGVVRSMSCTGTNGLAHLNLNDLSGMVVVNVPAKSEPVQLLDAVVRIRGACGSQANEQRQFVGFVMWASSLADVQVEESGAADPLSLPVQSIASLDQFHPRQTLQHRVNLAGVVTYAETNFFFIQDAEAGVRVQATVNNQLKPGDYVMASGYPGPGNYGHLLNDAVFKIISHRPVPAPRELLVAKPLDPHLHDLWVQVKARFLHYSKIGTVDVLSLQVGNRVFDVRVTAPVSARIKNLESGSLLQVTGIYRVLSDEARMPKSFQLAVASERDLRILEVPSWWTVTHTLTLFGVMGVLIGATILWVVVLRRKVQEQTASLKQSEHKFRSLVEQSLVGVYIIQDGRFVYANPRLAAIFGYAPEELIGASLVEDVIFWEDRPLVREQIRRRIAGEIDSAHYFFRGRAREGNLIQLEVLGSRTEFGGRPAVLGMLLDITERKQAQDKIAAQARMLDLASDAIMVCDLEGRIQYWNHNAQRIYGWTAPQAVGGLASEKMHIAPADFEKARQALLKDHQWHGEFTHHDHQGGELIVSARWTLVHNSEGKPNSILTINTDVTQQKRLEAQFLRAQRLDSIGVLARGIAHDLNNALAPILMSGQLLEMDPDLPDRDQMVATILASTQRAANLVKQIQTFARGAAGQRHTVEPGRLLEELRKILEETLPKSIFLRISSAPDMRAITADATQMHQVLMNLCLNARDAMPNGGELIITAANTELDQFHKHHGALGGETKPGPYVVFSVTDNGTGMASEIRELIFDPFFTTKPVGQGTGLGLSTALGIVKSHGGFIQVQSQPNRGASFKFYLPAETTAALPAAENSPKGNQIVSGHNELILVVDDEVPLRNLAKQTLVMFGYRVVTASNGEEAIACYTQQKDEIALVFTDLMMPVMDGPATIQALVQINPEVKIVVASGLGGENQIASPAVRAFLLKPYTAEKMLNAIHEALKAKAAKVPAVS